MITDERGCTENCAASHLGREMEKTRIIIDTDIGDDVDDALAIALALSSSEIELCGITTVYKNVGMRSALAYDLLRIFGKEKDIPVISGFSQPIRYHVDDTIIPHQCRGISNCSITGKPREAIDFIINTIKKNPETVIVAIGPMTNIGLAIKLAPEVMKNSKILAMGGAFSAVYPEYNIMCDPEAADIMINSGADVSMIGLDVTTKCVLSKEDEGLILNQVSQRGRYLAELAGIWLETSKAKKITLHDPLTIAAIVSPDILSMRREPIRIELEGTFTRGLTALCRTPFRQREPYPESIVSVADGVDSSKMRDLLFSRLFNK